MHASKEDKATLLDEAEDEVLTKCLSSDDEDDKYVLTKTGKVKLKNQGKKFHEEFTLNADEDDPEDTSKENFDHSQQKLNAKVGEEAFLEKDLKQSKIYENQEFTAFNMAEENSDLGKFNETTGNFEFEKDGDEKADTWLGDVNWIKVNSIDSKKLAGYKEKFKNDHEIYNSDGKITYSKRDVVESIEEILKFLLPHENVSMALKRLRPKKQSQKSKKQQERMRKDKYSFGSEEPKQEEPVTSALTLEQIQNKKDLVKLSDLANSIAGSGYYEIYQNSITQLEEHKDKILAEITGENKAKDDLDDIFGGSDEEVNENGEVVHAQVESEPRTQWEYKWGEEETAELYGPFDTTSMVSWKEHGHFTVEGMTVFVRRVGTDRFYPVNRVDFDLYE